MTSVLIKNGTIISAEGERKADVLIENGVIVKLTTHNKQLTTDDSMEIIDATGLLLFPGFIDCHVHFREPGLEHKETLATGAAAALAGGVTTVCEMPNTVPPVVTVAALADKVRRATELKVKNEKLKIDARFFFGATEPAHIVTLRELWTSSSEELRRLRARCCGLKLYLDHSTGNQKAGADVIDDAFRLCAELGITVVCHCEDPELNRVESEKCPPAGRAGKMESDVSAHSKRRPAESEAKSIEFAIGMAKKHGTHLHVAHLSTKQGIDLVRAAKKADIPVTCEVAPHHLLLTVDDYAMLGTLAKMNPPLRTRDHQEALWAGIADGTVDCISTDHAPHTLQEKNADNPLDAPSGVPGVETMVPLLLTVAGGSWPHPPGSEKLKMKSEKLVQQLFTFHFSFLTIHRLCFDNPNRIFNLGKQGIAEGAPADLVLVDPTAEWTIRGAELHSKCGWTPYEGWLAQGRIVRHVF